MLPHFSALTTYMFLQFLTCSYILNPNFLYKYSLYSTLKIVHFCQLLHRQTSFSSSFSLFLKNFTTTLSTHFLHTTFAFVYRQSPPTQPLQLPVCQTEIIKLISRFNQHIFHNSIKSRINIAV